MGYIYGESSAGEKARGAANLVTRKDDVICRKLLQKYLCDLGDTLELFRPHGHLWPLRLFNETPEIP